MGFGVWGLGFGVVIIVCLFIPVGNATAISVLEVETALEVSSGSSEGAKRNRAGRRRKPYLPTKEPSEGRTPRVLNTVQVRKMVRPRRTTTTTTTRTTAITTTTHVTATSAISTAGATAAATATATTSAAA